MILRAIFDNSGYFLVCSPHPVVAATLQFSHLGSAGDPGGRCFFSVEPWTRQETWVYGTLMIRFSSIMSVMCNYQKYLKIPLEVPLEYSKSGTEPARGYDVTSKVG